MRLTSGDATAPAPVGASDLRTYLGRQRFFFEAAERTAVPGVATGLAVTGTGGDVLFIEATRVAVGEDGLTLTGQLGDVMKESRASLCRTCGRTPRSSASPPTGSRGGSTCTSRRARCPRTGRAPASR